MKATIPGHEYILDGFIDKKNNQVIRFIHKEKKDDTDELELIADGTTNEEVLEMLIDRMTYLYLYLPDWYSKDVIKHLVDAHALLKERTQYRNLRGIGGTHKSQYDK